MVSMVEAINTLDALPVTAAMADIPPPSSSGKSPGKQLVLTARNKGACGSQIGVIVTVSAPGVTAALTPMRGSEGDPALDAALGVVGWNGTLSGDTALTTDVNAARLTLGWYHGSMLPKGELAAIYAAIIASKSDPVRPPIPWRYPVRTSRHRTNGRGAASRKTRWPSA
ncbi:MAG: hypothetical protein ACR5LG_12995 [Sodalis sp. (in: enterobacteria)]|uniref:hypothetical protein n=1 Tax=Sodalis sp. (in: enterobacteria) TaxID=1898979 RepID=UPI003F3B21C3